MGPARLFARTRLAALRSLIGPARLFARTRLAALGSLFGRTARSALAPLAVLPRRIAIGATVAAAATLATALVLVTSGSSSNARADAEVIRSAASEPSAAPSSTTPALPPTATVTAPVEALHVPAVAAAHPVLAPVPVPGSQPATGSTPLPQTPKTKAPAAPAVPQNNGQVVSVSSSDPIAQAVLSALNSSRAQAGLPALRWNSGLQRSAHQHNLAMATANQMSHQLPGEASFGARESAQGVSWSSAAENIGWTTSMSTGGALGLESDMMAEPPNQANHRANILSASSNSIGIDILLDSTNHKLWLTEDFAHV